VDGILTVLAGPDRGKTVIVGEGQSVVIGRDPRAKMQLSDHEISRLHCEVQNAGGIYSVSDLNSRNGTKVNDEKITKRPLRQGDVIEVGSTRIMFKVERAVVEQAAEPKAKPQVTPRRRPTGLPSPASPGAPAEESPAPGAILETIASAPENAAVEPGGDAFVGRKLGDFKVVAKLGAGDSASVYKAVQFSKNRLVALKVFPPEMARDAAAMTRFIRGAKSGSQLRHPNIVRILGGGQTEGIYYIFMEFVEGCSLRDLMKKAQDGELLAPKTCVNIATQLAEALQLAYEKRIVHRNIKPDNILVDKDGVVKLSDLGLAKTIQEPGGSDITDPGTILGTLNYMSPEQLADAGIVDHRSDIYSLGATLYALVTGIEPFASPSTLDTMIKIQKEKLEPASKHNPALPESLCRVIQKAMAKFPEERYQTPEELLLDLRKVKEEVEK